MIRKKIHSLLENLSRIVVSPTRYYLADKFIKGEGIEIGPSNRPVPLPKSARVKYVDRMTEKELKLIYPDLRFEKMPHISIIDDAEELQTITNSSQDFVIGNHLIEHFQDPIKAIKNFFRILRSGGIIYLAIPNKEFTFDRNRQSTTNEHLMNDYNNGPEKSKLAHYEEFVRLVENEDDPAKITLRVNELMSQNYSIHFHAWSQFAILKFFVFLKEEVGLGFEIEAFLKNGEECIAILKKQGKANERTNSC